MSKKPPISDSKLRAIVDKRLYGTPFLFRTPLLLFGFSAAGLEGFLGGLENKYPMNPTIEVAIPHFKLPPRNSTYRKRYRALQMKRLRCTNTYISDNWASQNLASPSSNQPKPQNLMPKQVIKFICKPSVMGGGLPCLM
jgi:hypothetical protein